MKFQHATKQPHPGLWQASALDTQAPNPASGDAPTNTVEAIVEQAMHGKPGQWVTIIGGQRDFIAQLLNAGIAKDRIRWLRSADLQQREWALEQAILAGTSSVIVGWLPSLDNRLQQRVRMAGRLSNTQSFLFEEDTLFTHLH